MNVLLIISLIFVCSAILCIVMEVDPYVLILLSCVFIAITIARFLATHSIGVVGKAMKISIVSLMILVMLLSLPMYIYTSRVVDNVFRYLNLFDRWSLYVLISLMLLLLGLVVMESNIARLGAFGSKLMVDLDKLEAIVRLGFHALFILTMLVFSYELCSPIPLILVIMFYFFDKIVKKVLVRAMRR